VKKTNGNKKQKYILEVDGKIADDARNFNYAVIFSKPEK